MILVTGGTGFLGSYLLRYLVKNGEDVRALKRPNSPMDLVRSIEDQVEWVEGDLLDIGSLEDAMKGIRKIYHAAALMSFDPSDREKMNKINIEGTANIVNIALEHPIQKMIHVSSIAALGRTENQINYTEKSHWKNSSLNSSYAISKFHAECEVWRGIEEGLSAAIVNPSVILGSGFWNSGTCKFFGQVDDGLKFYPTGQTGWVDVRDVARIMIELMNSPIEGERFIVSNENIYYQNLLSQIAHTINKKPPTIKATPFLREVAWRTEWLKSKIFSSKPILITRETAMLSSSRCVYDNSKLLESFNYSFSPIEETIKESAIQYLSSKEQGHKFATLPLLK